LCLEENYQHIGVFKKEEEEEEEEEEKEEKEEEEEKENKECCYHSTEERTIVVPLCVVCAGLFSLSQELTQSYIFDVMEDEYVKSGSVCTIVNKDRE
jgi:hypothetical protein